MEINLDCICGRDECQGGCLELQPVALVKVSTNGIVFERKIPIEEFLKGDLFRDEEKREFSEAENKKLSMHLDTHNGLIFVDPHDPYKDRTGTIGVSVNAEEFKKDVSLMVETIKDLASKEEITLYDLFRGELLVKINGLGEQKIKSGGPTLYQYVMEAYALLQDEDLVYMTVSEDLTKEWKIISFSSEEKVLEVEKIN